jgi:hypothetical protein
LSDLYQFDILDGRWTNLSRTVQGDKPTARVFHGFASAGGKLYVFGGMRRDGESSSFLGTNKKNSC